VPRNLLTPLPDSVDFESAAFTTLGAIALHGFRLAEPQLVKAWPLSGWGSWDCWPPDRGRGRVPAPGCRHDPQRVTSAASLGLETVPRTGPLKQPRRSPATVASMSCSSVPIHLQ